MRTLIDFVNHGTLPFTGRRGESDRLVRFFEEGRDAQGLQVLLLLGEAGVGKSRLVEEVAGRLRQIGGYVVHARLYPESPTAIVPLLAGALWRFATANPTLKVEVEESLVSVIGALRRLVRLRRVCLVIEDLHLVEGVGIGDLGAVLDALSDEQLSVLAAARPVELAARGVLERHILEEVDLSGLGRDDLDLLWRGLFGQPPEKNVLEVLADATAGNPLALRSALRGALKSGAIVFDEADKLWRITLSIEALSQTLDRNVRLLSQGMAAHLTKEEAQAAARIASLGELAARETAAMMVEGDDTVVEKLIFKGILTTTQTPVRNLAGERSAQPILAFTHSLLHRQFVESGGFDPSNILRVVASSLPLYSVTPFQIISDRIGEVEAEAPEVRQAIERGILVAGDLDIGPDWNLAMTVWQSAAALQERFASIFPADASKELRAHLLISYSALFHRGEEKEKRQALDELLQITEQAAGGTMIRYRLAALVNVGLFRYVTSSHRPDLALREEIEEFVAEHPWLQFTSVYRAHLSQISMAAALASDAATLGRLEKRMEELVGSPEADDSYRRELTRALVPDFLMLFETEDDLARRLVLLSELESVTDDMYYQGILFCKLQLLEQIGRMREVMESCRQAIPYFKARSLLLNIYFAERVELVARASFGMNLGDVADEARRICSGMHPSYVELQRSHMGYQLAAVGMLRGDVAWGRSMFEEFSQRRLSLSFERSILMETRDGDLARLIRETAAKGDPDAVTGALLKIGELIVGDGPSAVETALKGFEELVALPFLTITLPLAALAAIEILEAAVTGKTNRPAADRSAIIAAFKDSVVRLATRVMNWFAERGLHPYMRSALERAGGYLSRKEIASWRARIEEVAGSAPLVASAEASTSRLRLTMLGTIEIHSPGGEPTRPRGLRLRTLLGVMVADRMLDRPLGQREFYRLAVSDADDFDDARKTINLAVHRLRDTLGYDAISTQGETPQLNLDIVDVDLLHVHELLERADRMVREGNLHRSTAPLVEALDIGRGEVPFPGLYEEFFEAARDDFENRIRSQVLRLGRGLLREGDSASAEDLLRRAAAALPEDEEVVDLLHDALVDLGKRAEAERLKLKSGAWVE